MKIYYLRLDPNSIVHTNTYKNSSCAVLMQVDFFKKQLPCISREDYTCFAQDFTKSCSLFQWNTDDDAAPGTGNTVTTMSPHPRARLHLLLSHSPCKHLTTSLRHLVQSCLGMYVLKYFIIKYFPLMVPLHDRIAHWFTWKYVEAYYLWCLIQDNKVSIINSLFCFFFFLKRHYI